MPTTTTQEDTTMGRCPSIPEHRCLDCAPPTRGRPFTADGLSNGSPLGETVRAEAKPVAGYFERVELPRGDNRDGVVRIAEPAKLASAKRSSDRKPKAPRLVIPVIMGGRIR